MFADEAESLEATEEFGRTLGKLLFPGAVVALNGPLGAGKTHLTRAIVEGLGVYQPAAVNSPTFVLIQEYDGPIPVYHFDAYRLRSDREFAELGAHEYLNGAGVCIIEWAGKIERELPEERLEIELIPTGENSRRIVVRAAGSRYLEIISALESGR